MTITLALTVLGQKLGAIDIQIDVDQPAVGGTSPVVDNAVKRISRRWVRHMAS